LDHWISTFNDRIDLIPGVESDLVDPLTEAPIRWTPAMPEPKDAEGSARKFKQAWVAWARSFNVRMIVEAARLYRLTGNLRYADWAIRQIDFYAKNYGNWPLQERYSGKSRMMGISLDEATGSIQLLDAIRLLGDRVASERSAFWRENLFSQVANNSSSYLKMELRNNVALWHATAWTLICWHYRDSKCEEAALNGPNGVRSIFGAGVTKDFIWYERSFGYNNYVLRALVPLFVQASLLDRSHLFKNEMLAAAKMLTSPTQFRFEDGNLPSPGDGNTRMKAIDRSVYGALYRVLPSRIGIVEAALRKDWDSLLDPPTMPTGEVEPLPPVVTKNFEATRMGILVTGGAGFIGRPTEKLQPTLGR
jgi:hypothetical protein